MCVEARIPNGKNKNIKKNSRKTNFVTHTHTKESSRKCMRKSGSRAGITLNRGSNLILQVDSNKNQHRIHGPPIKTETHLSSKAQ